MKDTQTPFRQMCYACNRPQKSCLCRYTHPIKTKTKFVILIHPKEYKQIKNNTGRLTHLSLPNSHLFVGVDFTKHTQVNAIINDPKNYCIILFPSSKSITLNTTPLPLHDKQLVIFIIDATWASAKPMLRLSKNLHHLQKISFLHTKTSAYTFKRQPFKQALSTIESTLCVLEILEEKGIEKISKQALESFLHPFKEMVKFQIKCNKS